jgi:hypothetical protein
MKREFRPAWEYDAFPGDTSPGLLHTSAETLSGGQDEDIIARGACLSLANTDS